MKGGYKSLTGYLPAIWQIFVSLTLLSIFFPRCLYGVWSSRLEPTTFSFPWKSIARRDWLKYLLLVFLFNIPNYRLALWLTELRMLQNPQNMNHLYQTENFGYNSRLVRDTALVYCEDLCLVSGTNIGLFNYTCRNFDINWFVLPTGFLTLCC